MIAALTRTGIANYIAVLIWIYTMLILVRILLSWVQMAWTMPENPALRTVVGFIEDITEPYLLMWRKVIPPLRGGGGLIDLSPIIAIFALWLVGNLVVALIHG